MKKELIFQKYKGMDRSQLYQVYYDLMNEPNTKKERYVIQEILDSMEYKETNTYKSYPHYNEPDFIQRLTEKAEFYHQTNVFDEKNLENSCSSTEFELGKHQEFLRNFINEKTPYKGVIVFHGVGVGKTCTAVTISNSFRDIYRRKQKKIICLVSENIKPGWMKQIYDPTKGTNQCTGDSLHSLISDSETFLKDTDLKKQKKTNKMIKEFYDFYGYGKFSNLVSKRIQQSIGNRDLTTVEKEKKEKQIIQSMFSDRLLIIDEAHNLRSENESMDRDVLINLRKVIKYSQNLRLILLTATPLFNQPTEIIWLLNLLLKNDNRPEIIDKEIFTKHGHLKESGKEILQKKCRGYISYLRGENPVSFPIRLYPDSNQDKHSLKKPPSYNWKQQPIQDYQRFMKLYKTPMGYLQRKVYDGFVKQLNHDLKLSPMDRRTGHQLLNMVYPLMDDSINHKEMIGDKGIRKIMDISVKNNVRKYKYKKDYLEKYKEPCFSLKKLRAYSGKIKNIVEGIKHSKGIVFIYSEYLSSGLVPLALALEHAGYGKYGNKHLWEKNSGDEQFQEKPLDCNGEPTTASKQAKYIILSADPELSPNNEKEIQQVVSDKNKYGETIKIILGNVVASEGLDLKNIREIHILEPWFHLFRLEQIIGRGIRRCSHKELPEEERNVTIYHHVSYEKEDIETIDMNTYRVAEMKAIEIGSIETILKQNAIDCILNKGSNVIQSSDVQPRKLITSRNTIIPSFDVSDKPMTKLCSFQPECNYPCLSNISQTINYDTFTIENSKQIIKTIQKIIIEMYSLNNYYSLKELETTIQDTIDCNPRVIYLAINTMIENRLSIWNSLGMEGFLINRGEYYYFQPKSNTDPLLPFYYRQTKNTTQSYKQISLEDVFTNMNEEDVIDTPEEVVDENTQNIQDIYKEIFCMDVLENQTTMFRFQKKKYDFQGIIDYDAYIMLSHTLDRLHYTEKIQLLSHILSKKIKPKKPNYDPSVPFRVELKRLYNQIDEADTWILYYFRNNLIYKDKNQYVIFENDLSKDIVGFMVHNIDLFYQQPKELDNIFETYEYYILNKDTFMSIKELETGKTIVRSIKRNFEKNKDSLFLNMSNFWGFSFKMKKHNHVLKIADNTQKANKVPGFIVNSASNTTNIKQFLEKLSPEIYQKYKSAITPQNSKHYNSKLFLCLLFEMLLRKQDMKSQNIVFIPYDLVFLKFL